ncbi:MAG: HAMP domain-containing histidine kinase [Acidobacteriota bacterium]|nr:HAMP domain-containing histidine kinase [Acidobacteriota bacterium]
MNWQTRKGPGWPRLTLPLELAIILPAATLILVSALHLRSIRQDRAVEAAIERGFNEVLAIGEKNMNQQAYELLDEIRLRFPAPNEACSVTLDTLLASHPYAAHAFLYDPGVGMVFRSRPLRLNEPGFRAESADLQKMMEDWMKLDYPTLVERISKIEKKGTPYFVFANWAPRGDKHAYQPVALFLQHDPAGGETAIGGIAFDPEFLRDRFFPNFLDTMLIHGSNPEQPEKNHAVLVLVPRGESSPLAASADWDGGTPEAERNLEAVFPGLTLGIKLRGTTVEALGRHFMISSFLVLGALSVLLAGGIWLTLRNVSRQMELARLKSDFVSNVSHELRTPLSLIRLYAETLELDRLSGEEKRQEYFRIIRKESERLSALINNILDFSRIEAGRKEYDFRDTDIADLVRNTLEAYRYQIQQHGFTLEEEIADDLPRLRVDREAIARSLLNLVNNSVKYSAEDKFLRVSLYRENESLKLEVLDHGIGIPRNEHRKIFEKFYRSGDPLVHTTKGSGLGLSLVRHIVEAHQGEIRVDSAPGQGSRFIITLPIPPPVPYNGRAA